MGWQGSVVRLSKSKNLPHPYMTIFYSLIPTKARVTEENPRV